MALNLKQDEYKHNVRDTLLRSLVTRKAIHCARTNGAPRLAIVYRDLLDKSVEEYNNLSGQAGRKGDERTNLEKVPALGSLPGTLEVLQGKSLGEIHLQGVGVAILGDAVFVDSPFTAQAAGKNSDRFANSSADVCLNCHFYRHASNKSSEWGMCVNHSIFKRQQQIVWANYMACRPDFGSHHLTLRNPGPWAIMKNLTIVWLIGLAIIFPIDIGLVMPAIPEMTVAWITLGLALASAFLAQEAAYSLLHFYRLRVARNTIDQILKMVENQA